MAKKRKILAAALGILIIAIVGIFILKQQGETHKVEVMDLYGNIIPYQPMSYGDDYVAKKVFNSLIVIDDYEVSLGLAAEYNIDSNVISVKLGQNKFKLPNREVAVKSEDILDYYNNILIKLTGSNTITNPGLRNLSEVKVDGDRLIFTFKSESAVNILALTERIGYIYESKWYGTQAKVEYNVPEIKVDDIIYIPVSSEKGLTSSERISSMMLANVLADDTVNLTKVENGHYGFITWGSNSAVTPEQRKLIFQALENSSVRNSLSLPTKSIFADTALYTEAPQTNIKSLNSDNIPANELKVGVVSLGSFKEIQAALEIAFGEIGVPIRLQTAELNDLVNSGEFDIVYVRLMRGISPNITGVFNSGGLLDTYADDYAEEIKAVNQSKTWNEICKTSAALELKLREDGVWMFLDRAYDISTTKK